MRFTAGLVLALGVGLMAAPTSAESLDALFDQHPQCEVLPRPYFEPGLANASYLDLRIDAASYLPRGTPWFAEVQTGTCVRYPARGTTTQPVQTAFLTLGDRPITQARVRLYAVASGRPRLAAELALPRISPTRFNAAYQRGPLAHEASWRWGEDGLWLVLLQLRYKPDFWRESRPVLYVGGDFNINHVEGLVRYMRSHGVDALGYKPDYARDNHESTLAMARADWPFVRRFLQLAAGGRPTQLVGLCVGGLQSRGMAYVERVEEHARSPLIAGVATVGTPNHGVTLADYYNDNAWVLPLHRFLSGDPSVHCFKDSIAATALFNRQVGTSGGVPLVSVVLDATGCPVDPRYAVTDAPLRWYTSWRTGLPASRVATDGLILVNGQAIGRQLAIWHTDHAGMLNDSRGASAFDAYQAHLDLIETLATQRESP